jgi:hypothetical protein
MWGGQIAFETSTSVECVVRSDDESAMFVRLELWDELAKAYKLRGSFGEGKPPSFEVALPVNSLYVALGDGGSRAPLM